jgi:hypothetical protein
VPTLLAQVSVKVFSVLSPDALSANLAYNKLVGTSLATQAFLASSTTALGEELAFRGTQQPLLGLPFTTVLFVIIHTQHLTSPGLRSSCSLPYSAAARVASFRRSLPTSSITS